MHILIPLAAATVLAGASSGAHAATLDAAGARAAAEELAVLLEREYLFPDVGRRYAAALRDGAAAGAWDGLADPAALAGAWERELRAVQDDAHLRILVTDRPSGPQGTMQRLQQDMDALGEGRWLAPGVAYLPIRLLPGDPESVAQMARFLDEFAGATTLVLDLRACLGGTLPVMDELFARIYAEPARLLRMDMRDRANDGVLGMFNQVPSLRREDAPEGIQRFDHWVTPRDPDGPWARARVYALTDVTASACEHLSYALKLSGRATLVGGNTRGAGHFGGLRGFGGQFEVFVPVGRTYDVGSGLGWESTGIAPQVAVAPEDALRAALVEAGVDPAVAAGIETPRPPARAAQAGSGQRRYGLGLAPPRGGETSLAILEVPAGSVAERAGVRRGDRILRMNGRAVSEIGGAEITGYLRGSPLELVVEREGAELTIRMSLDDATAPAG
ncbi:MAG TPA: S41 family peptidase [Steroidobacteraceae bacterium]|nr:S41 family peptidase [Steroidobacteraceae bacterium]